ncbi:MAG: ATPase, T2SS/T4P/T4SS family, partial [Patescibacteria group bacterium]
MVITFNEDKQTKRLDELRDKEAEDLARMLSEKYALPYVDLSKLPINTDALRLIPAAEAEAGQIAAFKISGRNLSVIIISPNNQVGQKIIHELSDQGFTVTLYLGSTNSLERALSRYREISGSTRTEAGVVDIANDKINASLGELKSLDEVKEQLAAETAVALKEGGVTNLLEIILTGAMFAEASDIHLEPEAERVRLRYRLDGVLNDFTFFDQKIYRSLLSRIKLISGLKLNLKTTAQDGRFSVKLGAAEIEIRAAVLPGAYGESVVLRLLNPKTLLVEFSGLGLEPVIYEALNKEIAKPNGLILLTGPTGSGKTTTLYAILRQLNSTETKIITIEDPIEYHL